ncbi:hypothetical protein ACQPZX_31125 [Actinoplanes sp. CA-142083]|uniref:hypothetical protein n=1 Tax=Actinoplanes sp. CA-142083 TaxID=3239903 RepID=UPI003D8E13E9
MTDPSEAYAALLADVARSVPLAEGLAAIVGTPPAQPPAEPGATGYTRLLADVAGTVDLPAGAGDILGAEGGYAGLLGDVSTGVNLAAGLADILDPPAPGAPRPQPPINPIAINLETTGSGVAMPPLGAIEPSVRSDLDRIAAASGTHRLLLRLNGRHRTLQAALDTIGDIRRYLTHATPAATIAGPYEEVPAALAGHRESLAQVVAMLASTLPVVEAGSDDDPPAEEDPGPPLSLQGPDGSRYIIRDAPPELTVRDLIAELYPDVSGEALDRMVADRIGPDGERHRVGLDQTLDEAGVQNVEQLRFGFEARAGGSLSDLRIPISVNCRVLVSVRSVAELEEAERQLRDLGLEPTFRTASTRTTTFEVNSPDVAHVTFVLEGSELEWTVAGPDQPDYVVSELSLQGPDGRRFIARDTPALRTLREVAEGMISEHYSGTASGGAIGNPVVDRIGLDGEPRRADLDQTLDEADVQDGEQIRLGFEWDFAISTRLNVDDVASESVTTDEPTPLESDPAEVDEGLDAGALARADALLHQVADGLMLLDEPELFYRLGPDDRERCRESAADLDATLLRIAEALGSFHGDDLRDAEVREADLEDVDGARWCDRTAGEPTRWPTAVESQIVEHSEAVPWAPGEWVVRFGAPVRAGR